MELRRTDVLVLESNSPGGQAGTSSKIENYLGFPTGISGQELAGRAYTQAQKFGAQMLIAKNANGLACDRRHTPYRLMTVSMCRLAPSLLLPAPNIENAVGEPVALRGRRCYYGATHLRHSYVAVKRHSGWRRNSAGQAAVFLAQTAGAYTCSSAVMTSQHDVAVFNSAH